MFVIQFCPSKSLSLPLSNTHTHTHCKESISNSRHQTSPWNGRWALENSSSFYKSWSIFFSFINNLIQLLVYGFKYLRQCGYTLKCSCGLNFAYLKNIQNNLWSLFVSLGVYVVQCILRKCGPYATLLFWFQGRPKWNWQL